MSANSKKADEIIRCDSAERRGILRAEKEWTKEKRHNKLGTYRSCDTLENYTTTDFEPIFSYKRTTCLGVRVLCTHLFLVKNWTNRVKLHFQSFSPPPPLSLVPLSWSLLFPAHFPAILHMHVVWLFTVFLFFFFYFFFFVDNNNYKIFKLVSPHLVIPSFSVWLFSMHFLSLVAQRRSVHLIFKWLLCACDPYSEVINWKQRTQHRNGNK